MPVITNELIWWAAQITLDIILLIIVFVLLARLKKGKGMGHQAPLATEDFVEQAGQLAREFDRLLGEKRELVATTMSTLDASIGELRAMLEQAQALQQKTVSAKSSATPAPSARNTVTASASSPIFQPAPSTAPMLDDDPFNLPPGHPLHQLGSEASNPQAEQEFRKQVVALHRKGQTPQKIAIATGRPRAEVELLLALIK